MQKIINVPSEVVDEMLQGFVKANPDIVVAENPRVLKLRAAPIAGKVGIVTGGGSGHKPAFVGYIGHNLVDAVAVGEIFSSPPAQMFHDAFRAADAGKGVACLYGNYAGDNMNVKMAIEMAADSGTAVKTVVANDDVPSAPAGDRQRRRGVAGEILMWKVAGAKAAMGASLDQVIAAAQKAMDNTRSMGVGLSACTIPEVGHSNFTVEDGKMEVGIGHHGEPGIAVVPLEPAERIARRMTDIILPDLPFAPGDSVTVLLSGLGATPPMELFILYNNIRQVLDAQGLKVRRSYVGDYFTSLDMAGATLTIMKTDDELGACIDYPASSWGLTQWER